MESAAPGTRAEAASVPSRAGTEGSGLLRVASDGARLSGDAPARPPSAASALAVLVLAASVLSASVLSASDLAASAAALSALAAAILSVRPASLRADTVSSRRAAGRIGAAGFRSAASRLKRGVPSLPRAADEAVRGTCLNHTSARSARETTMPSLSSGAEDAGGHSKRRATGAFSPSLWY
ncbi:hypothetical protein GCM10025880_16810 [Methylorubrum aminovorans]|nr:hypothetical protein GCM10025880_16810 [Methylorubrum aminovorans]